MKRVSQLAGQLGSACLLLSTSMAISYAQPWSTTATVTTTETDYQGANTRQALHEANAYLNVDHAEYGGVTVGQSYSKLDQNTSTRLTQDTDFVSGRLYVEPEGLAGKLTFRLDGHRITTREQKEAINLIEITAGQVSYMDLAKTMYLDIGFAHSKYPTGFEISQITPTFAFAFNNSYDWIQTRMYVNESSNSGLTFDKSRTAALETKWTHWWGEDAAWIPNNLQTMFLLGQRMYGVEMDGAVVYNLPYIQKKSFYVGPEWKLEKHYRIGLMVGGSSYENPLLNETFKGRFGFLKFSAEL